MKKFLWALVVGGLLSSCSTVNVTKSQRYPQVYAERPGTVLQLADCAVEPTGLLCVSAAADHGNSQGGECL